MSFNKLFFLMLISPIFCHAQILDRFSESKGDDPIIIEAENSVVCDETVNKCVAIGNASAKKGTNTVYGDVLTVFFTEGKERDITAMTADGHVRMETPTGKGCGDHAYYDLKLDSVLLTGGNLKILTPKETITARDSIEYWHKDNKGIARGQATALFPEKEELIQADTLVAYFKPSSEKTEESKEKLSIDKVEAEGHMLASSPKSVVTGDRGIYSAKDHLVEVFNNVKVMQGENVIEGGYARHNLETDVAEMFTKPPHVSQSGSERRIFGIIIPEDAKKMKEKEAASFEETSSNHNDGQLFPISAKKRSETRSQ